MSTFNLTVSTAGEPIIIYISSGVLFAFKRSHPEGWVLIETPPGQVVDVNAENPFRYSPKGITLSIECGGATYVATCSGNLAGLAGLKAGDWMQKYAADLVPPIFYEHPTNLIIKPSNPNSDFFAVAVSSDELPTLQWEFDAGAGWTAGDIDTNPEFSGWNGDRLTPTNLVTKDQDTWRFRCVATNSAGSATSLVASLTIDQSLPVITLQPVDVRGTDGQIVTLSANADDFNNVEWYDDGVIIPNESAPSLGIQLDASSPQNQPYSAKFYNLSGSTDTDTALVSHRPNKPNAWAPEVLQPGAGVTIDEQGLTISKNVQAGDVLVSRNPTSAAPQYDITAQFHFRSNQPVDVSIRSMPSGDTTPAASLIGDGRTWEIETFNIEANSTSYDVIINTPASAGLRLDVEIFDYSMQPSERLLSVEQGGDLVGYKFGEFGSFNFYFFVGYDEVINAFYIDASDQAFLFTNTGGKFGDLSAIDVTLVDTDQAYLSWDDSAGAYVGDGSSIATILRSNIGLGGVKCEFAEATAGATFDSDFYTFDSTILTMDNEA